MLVKALKRTAGAATRAVGRAAGAAIKVAKRHPLVLLALLLVVVLVARGGGWEWRAEPAAYEWLTDDQETKTAPDESPEARKARNKAQDAEFGADTWRFQGSVGSCNFYSSGLKKDNGKARCKSWTVPTGIDPSKVPPEFAGYQCVQPMKKATYKKCSDRLWGKIWEARHPSEDESRYAAA